MKALNLFNFADIIPSIASTPTVADKNSAAPINKAIQSHTTPNNSTDLSYLNPFDTACLAYHIMGFGKF